MARLQLLHGSADAADATRTYPQLEDIVLRGLTARDDGEVLDRVCDVIVALEMAGVVEVSGRCYGPKGAPLQGEWPPSPGRSLWVSPGR